MNIQSIKETLIAPIVATIITIGLVTDWPSMETPDKAVVTDNSMPTASQSIQTDGHSGMMGHSRVGSGDAMLIKLVYRLPLRTVQHDQYTQGKFLQRAPVVVDSPASVTIQYQQVMTVGSSTGTWWM